jgi:hypothetical protein
VCRWRNSRAKSRPGDGGRELGFLELLRSTMCATSERCVPPRCCWSMRCGEKALALYEKALARLRL